jgi:hypothetical protein
MALCGGARIANATVGQTFLSASPADKNVCPTNAATLAARCQFCFGNSNSGGLPVAGRVNFSPNFV